MTSFLQVTRPTGAKSLLPVDKIIEIQESTCSGCNAKVFMQDGAQMYDIFVKDSIDDIQMQLRRLKENR